MSDSSKYPKTLINEIAELIDAGNGSRYRQDWFDFKQSRLERFVSEQLCGSEQYEQFSCLPP